jgi:hypothetical protein
MSTRDTVIPGAPQAKSLGDVLREHAEDLANQPTEAEGDADTAFLNWETYFKIALEGSATSMSTPEAIVRQADLVAQAAVKMQLKRRGAT